jgi:hypothetical protein
MFPLVTPEAQSNAGFEPEIGFSVREVMDEQWPIVAWLWQSYRHDLALVVNGLPYADGRYQTAVLNEYPMADGAGYLAWRPHPKSGEDAPIGFAVIKGLKGERRSIEGFWVAPVARREGVGTKFALDMLSRHDGPWTIVFSARQRRRGGFLEKSCGRIFRSRTMVGGSA